MATADWIPVDRQPEQTGKTYRVRVRRTVLGLPEVAETTAMWTADGWEFTDGLLAPERSRVTAWKPVEPS
jgi:hypothetical protein